MESTIDVNKLVFQVQANHYKVQDDHTIFNFKVSDSTGFVFHICDRYSSIMQFNENLSKATNGGHGIPSFPKKKFFGSKSPKFLDERKMSLQRYFNGLLC
jgi:hypothetical protein